MVYADGTTYEGQWSDNVMHGEGSFLDSDSVRWDGFFINGSYESKIQKKLRVEKEIKVKVNEYQEHAKHFFVAFMESFQNSDPKFIEQNMQ